MVDVEKLRAQIPACQQVVYLNSGWSGPSPRRVLDAITARLEYESALGPTTAEVVAIKQRLQEEAASEAAALLNASPDEVFLTQNTTEGINIVLSGLPWREGDEIVTCDLEHASVLVPAYHLRSRGIRVRVVHVEPAASWEEIVQGITEAFTPRTRMVFLSHIEYTSGLRMPIEQLGALCRSRGIWLLSDGAQTAGHIALDMERTGVDFYATTGHKWLLGPYGAGVLFIRRELIPEVQPTFVSSHAVASYDTEGDFQPNPSTMAKFGLTTSSTELRTGFVEAIRLAPRDGHRRDRGPQRGPGGSRQGGTVDGRGHAHPLAPRRSRRVRAGHLLRRRRGAGCYGRPPVGGGASRGPLHPRAGRRRPLVAPRLHHRGRGRDGCGRRGARCEGGGVGG